MRTILETTVEGIIFKAYHFPAVRDDNGCAKNSLLFCLPGGGSSADYFNLLKGHSFAVEMAYHEWDVLIMDHPGTGMNTLPEDHPFLTPQKSIEYVSNALSQWMKDEWVECEDIIGVGHSMGGMMITLLQAHMNPFKAIGLFGSNAGGLEWGLSDHEKTYIDKPEEFARDLEQLTLAKFQIPFPKGLGGPSGKSITFGGETPELSKRLREVSCNLYAAGGMMSMTRGSFRKEVEAIDVPIFFAFGDHDIGIPPEDAPKDYINAPSTELVVLENTGHNHFAFRSIKPLCEKLDYWASNLD